MGLFSAEEIPTITKFLGRQDVEYQGASKGGEDEESTATRWCKPVGAVCYHVENGWYSDIKSHLTYRSLAIVTAQV